MEKKKTEVTQRKPSKLASVSGSKRLPGIRNTAESYCNWDQRAYTKSSYNKITHDKGSCSDQLSDRILELSAGGKLGKDFLLQFAAAGGTIEDGVLKINASAFESMKQMLAASEAAAPELKISARKEAKGIKGIIGKIKGIRIFGGNRIQTANPGTNADWDKHYYCKSSYCKEMHDRSVSQTNHQADYVEIAADGKLDKDFLIQFANAGGIIDNGVLKAEASKVNGIKALLKK